MRSLVIHFAMPDHSARFPTGTSTGRSGSEPGPAQSHIPVGNRLTTDRVSSGDHAARSKPSFDATHGVFSVEPPPSAAIDPRLGLAAKRIRLPLRESAVLTFSRSATIAGAYAVPSAFKLPILVPSLKTMRPGSGDDGTPVKLTDV